MKIYNEDGSWNQEFLNSEEFSIFSKLVKSMFDRRSELDIRILSLALIDEIKILESLRILSEKTKR